MWLKSYISVYVIFYRNIDIHCDVIHFVRILLLKGIWIMMANYTQTNRKFRITLQKYLMALSSQIKNYNLKVRVTLYAAGVTFAMVHTKTQFCTQRYILKVLHPFYIDKNVISGVFLQFRRSHNGQMLANADAKLTWILTVKYCPVISNNTSSN